MMCVRLHETGWCEEPGTSGGIDVPGTSPGQWIGVRLAKAQAPSLALPKGDHIESFKPVESAIARPSEVRVEMEVIRPESGAVLAGVGADTLTVDVVLMCLNYRLVGGSKRRVLGQGRCRRQAERHHDGCYQGKGSSHVRFSEWGGPVDRFALAPSTDPTASTMGLPRLMRCG